MHSLKTVYITSLHYASAYAKCYADNFDEYFDTLACMAEGVVSDLGADGDEIAEWFEEWAKSEFEN